MFQTPVIVDNDGMNRFDLLKPNEAVHESEVSRSNLSSFSTFFLSTI